MRQPLGQARLVEEGNRVADEPVVAGGVKRNQRLDTRVADVLQPLVIRTVDVGFGGTEPRRPPADLPDLGQRGIIARKCAVFTERIPSGLAAEVVDRQRFRAGFDAQLDVAIGAVIECREPALGPAVRQEAVLDAVQLATRDLVAVALGKGSIEERLGIGERHGRAAAAADDEPGKGVRLKALVE